MSLPEAVSTILQSGYIPRCFMLHSPLLFKMFHHGKDSNLASIYFFYLFLREGWDPLSDNKDGFIKPKTIFMDQGQIFILH